MSSVDRERLSERLGAYLDGELDTREQAEVQALLHNDEDARLILAELRRAADLVASLPRHKAPPGIVEDLQQHLERAELLNGGGEATGAESGRRSPIRALLGMVAMLAIVLGGTWAISEYGPFGQDGDTIVALKDSGDDTESWNVPDNGEAAPAATMGDRARSSMAKHAATARPSASLDRLTQGRSPASEMRFAKVMDLDQKFRMGLGMEAVTDHSFENERIRLRVVLANEGDREAAVKRLTQHLSAEKVQRLSTSRRAGQDAGSAGASFYFRGRSGRNFDDKQQRQVLVRMDSTKLGGLIAQFDRTADPTVDVELTSGWMVARGVEDVRQLVARMDGSSVVEPIGGAIVTSTYERSDEQTVADQIAKGGRSVRAVDDHAVNEFLGFFGLKQEMMPEFDESAGTDPKGAEPPAGPSKSAGQESLRRGEAEHGADVKIDSVGPKRSTPSEHKDSATAESADATGAKAQPIDKEVAGPPEQGAAAPSRMDRRKRAKFATTGQGDASGRGGSVDEPTSLVQRRLRALAESAKPQRTAGKEKSGPTPEESAPNEDGTPVDPTPAMTAMAGEKVATAPEATGAAPRLITLVVEFVVAKPPSARPTGSAPAKPAAKNGGETGGGKSTKPGDAKEKPPAG